MTAFSGSDASTEHFDLTYYDPPAGLEKYVLALFHFEWDETEISDRHPGALGQLFLTPRGTGFVELGNRSDPIGGQSDGLDGEQAGAEAQMFSGFETASPFKMRGPWHSVGASLSPLGWAAFAGVPANTHMDRLVPAREFLGEEIDEFAGALCENYRQGTVSGEAACRALADWIAPRLQPVPPLHEALIEHTLSWLGSSLNPDVEPLFSKLKYSRRQTERLVARYFGFSPAALARKMRAVRAANLLALPQLNDEAEAEIAAAFYDQPHMIREIRRYCGYTPARLGGPDEPLFLTMLRMKNLDRLKHYRQIGTGD